MEPLPTQKPRAERIRKPFTARFRILKCDQNFDDPSKWNIITIKNLSSSGIFFQYNEQLEVGTGLELNISLPFINGPAHCLGRVCRVEDDPQFRAGLRKTPFYGIAAYFEIIDDNVKEAIDNFAGNLSLKK